jgi:hypothetical protein
MINNKVLKTIPLEQAHNDEVKVQDGDLAARRLEPLGFWIAFSSSVSSLNLTSVHTHVIKTGNTSY